MSTAAESSTQRLFPYERWSSNLDTLAEQYRSAQPYPHIHLVDFLNDDVMQSVVDAFPKPGDTNWTNYKHYNENKLGKNDRNQFPSAIGELIDELNSDPFVEWLSKITSIEGLMADPMLEGGGMHQTERGGFLNIHADFTMHHYHKNWHRRCNLIIYLNDGWQESWGGTIELWDQSMTRCVAKTPPLMNHALIFSTTDTSFHGYSEPLQCPQSETRKSLALYYYTHQTDPTYSPKSTNYKPIPSDGRLKSLGIWLDKTVLAIYTRVKTTLGLPDNFASWVLGLFSRKKKP